MAVLTVICNGTEQKIEFTGSPLVCELIDIPHPCGKRGTCGKCGIDITGAVCAPTEREKELGMRLSCQTRLFGDATVVLKGENTVAVQDGEDREFEKDGICAEYGLATDIGTTTLAMRLYDLDSGKLIGKAEAVNPQISDGADVMARLSADPEKMTECVKNAVADMEKKLISGINGRIDRVTVGNTAMLHLYFGENTDTLKTAPFEPKEFFGRYVDGIYAPDCIGGFVGADLCAAVLASGMTEREETALLCDIGTNGETALIKDGRLYVASSPAGPAFEGVGISSGTVACDGAVYRVASEDGRIVAKTLCGKAPTGLCGSGLIDAIAVLLDLGLIDKSGKTVSEILPVCRNVTLTANDVRAFQLAKAAVCAGIRSLLEITKTPASQIKRLYICGGFGSRIDVASAKRTGLIPKEICSGVTVMGNGAITGASMMLFSKASRIKCKQIAKSAVHTELGGNEIFKREFIDCISF